MLKIKTRRPKQNIKRKLALFILVLFVVSLLPSEQVKADTGEETTKKATDLASETQLNPLSKVKEDLMVEEEQDLVLEPEKELGTYFLESQPAMQYTQEDVYVLATVIYAEAGICDDMEKYRVGNVVLNRVADSTGEFEDTILGVIYQSGQFDSVGTDNWYHGPTDVEIQIAQDLLEGARVFPSEVVWFSKKMNYGTLYYKSEWHEFSGWEVREEG